ncbi:MAG: U32 family peptidase, partial [Planctomycetota bacterium]
MSDSPAPVALAPELPPPELLAPELLAPAGDWACVDAAIENGADAIYFGLDCGFNARFRAKNFHVDDLPELTTRLRTRGVRGYVTMNTLVFPSELAAAGEAIRRIGDSGIDAVLVQDFGLARFVKRICPDLELHASTQMSLTSAETIAVATDLGLDRVVLARELSVREIRQITSACPIPVEVFIHGALCVAYSGQCLTSESLGGRSANRGQCAQACRLPYALVCDDQDRDLDDVRYLLSPQDLAGYASVPDLIDAGVASLKIEGRLKTPEYVANITSKYRAAIDAAMQNRPSPIDDVAAREMELSFSRGFTPGWLEGNDHKRLVPGITSAKQGIEIGNVQACRPHRIRLRLAQAVAPGDGIAIMADETTGGRVHQLLDTSERVLQRGDPGQTVYLDLGRGFEASEQLLGKRVFKNDDPQLSKRLRGTFQNADPVRRRSTRWRVEAICGQALRMTVTAPAPRHAGMPNAAAKRPHAWVEADDWVTVSVIGDDPLPVARKRPITAVVLREKIGELGGTPFRVEAVQCVIQGDPMVPLAAIKRLRREAVAKLHDTLAQAPKRHIDPAAIASLGGVTKADRDGDPTPAFLPDAKAAIGSELCVLCRTLEQVEAASRESVDWVYVDLHDVRQYRQAREIATEHSRRLAIASVRIQKPGEMGLLRVLQRHRPEAVLGRNLAALKWAIAAGIPAIADFSLNVTNQHSADWLLGLGVQRVTASYDLNRDQCQQLLHEIRPRAWQWVI